MAADVDFTSELAQQFLSFPPLSAPLSLPLSQIKIKSFLTMMGIVRRPRNLSGKGSSTTAPTTGWALPFSLPLSLSLSLSLSLTHLAASPPQWRCASPTVNASSSPSSPFLSLFFSLFPLFFLSFFPQELPTSRNAHLLLVRYVPCRKARVMSARGLSFGEYFSPVEKPILENGLSRRFHQWGKF